MLDGPGGDDLLAIGTPLVAAAPWEDPSPLKDNGERNLIDSTHVANFEAIALDEFPCSFGTFGGSIDF